MITQKIWGQYIHPRAKWAACERVVSKRCTEAVDAKMEKMEEYAKLVAGR